MNNFLSLFHSQGILCTRGILYHYTYTGLLWCWFVEVCFNECGLFKCKQTLYLNGWLSRLHYSNHGQLFHYCTSRNSCLVLMWQSSSIVKMNTLNLWVSAILHAICCHLSRCTAVCIRAWGCVYSLSHPPVVVLGAKNVSTCITITSKEP